MKHILLFVLLVTTSILFAEVQYSDTLLMKAKGGNAEAQFQLSECYRYGRGIAGNKNETIKWLKLAADNGYAEAQYELGHCYESGMGVTQNESKAINFCKLAAYKGFAPAQLDFGSCFMDGKGVTRNKQIAEKWFRLAAKNGDAQIQHAVGLYLFYSSSEKNKPEGIQWLKSSAIKGSIAAQKELGFLYFYGRGVIENEAEALKWFRMAAESGNTDAQYYMGEYYYYGKIVEQSFSDAFFWYSVSKSGLISYELDYIVSELSQSQIDSCQRRIEQYLEEKDRSKEIPLVEIDNLRYTGEMEIVDIPAQELEKVKTNITNTNDEIFNIIQSQGANDTYLSAKAKYRIQSKLKPKIIFPDEPKGESRAFHLDARIITRLCIKPFGSIAVNRDTPGIISDLELTTLVINKLNDNHNMIFLVTSEDEFQTDDYVRILKLLRANKVEKFLVMKATSDEDSNPDFDNNVYEEAQSQIDEFLKVSSTKTAPPDSVKPFHFTPYDEQPEYVTPPKVEYPIWAKEKGIRGTVFLEVDVYKDGTVGEVRVRKSVFPGLDEIAVNAIKKVRFQPGKSSGQPVDTTVMIPIEF